MTASKPRARARKRLNVVRLPRTPDGVAALLSESLGRADDDDVLAVLVIEVCREGRIVTTTFGDEHGFRHHLVAGLQYAMRDLTEADE